MIKKIKNFFKKKQEKIDFGYKDEIDILLKYNFNSHCKECIFAEDCKKTKDGHFCDRFSADIDPNKKTFLIIDDNKGINLIIKELIYELEEEGKIDLSNWNIIDFYSKQAILFLMSDTIKGKIPNIDAAFLDVTFGSIVKVKDRKIKLNGLHLAIFLYERFKTKIRFYTGNNLNSYIKDHKMKQVCFNNIFGDDIEKYIIKKDTSDDDLKVILMELLK